MMISLCCAPCVAWGISIFTILTQPFDVISLPHAPGEIEDDGIVLHRVRDVRGDGPLIFAIPEQMPQ
uniref:Uncharacterized protein n=1 Tax=Riptortus pedestris TaxID=329032 RepID=R4WKU0_RIPPE|nr:unknown secreted protein [Riptortus pedestris]